MKILKVEFKTETKEALFCDISYKTGSKLFGYTRHTREVYLERCIDSYFIFPRFSDTGNTIHQSGINFLMIRSKEEKEIIL